MKTCPQCGATNADDASFCTLCLTRWDAAQAVAAGAPAIPSTPAAATVSSERTGPGLDEAAIDKMVDMLRDSEESAPPLLPESWTTEIPNRSESAKRLAGELLPKRVAAIVIAALSLLYAFGHWWYPELRRLPYRHLTIEVPADAVKISETVDPVHLDAAFTTSADAATATEFFNRTMRTEKWRRNGWSGLMQDLGLGQGFSNVRGKYEVAVDEDWLERWSRRSFTGRRIIERESILVRYWPAGTTDSELERDHGQKAAAAARAGQPVITITVAGSLTHVTDFENAEGTSGR